MRDLPGTHGRPYRPVSCRPALSGGNPGGKMANQQLTVHFDKLKTIGLRGIWRATAFVAIGQKAWRDPDFKSAKINAPFAFQILPDPLPKEFADEVHSSFRLWLIGKALSEIVQSLTLSFLGEHAR